jgi:Protein of unknown function (DUF3592)
MKIVRLILGLFAVIGLGLLIGGIFSVRHTRHFLQTAVSVPGVVTENVWQENRTSYTRNSNSGSGVGSFHPRIRFRTADGQEISFITSNGSSPPFYRVNQPITILYDPQLPEHAIIKSFSELWLGPIILCGLGVIFCSFGVVAAGLKRMSTRKSAWLRQNGRHIQAEFIRVELNTTLEINGENPYRIVCQWLDPASNQMHIFRSPDIWFDPTKYITKKTLEVLMDPNNPHRYLVETSFLPTVV